MRIAANMLGIGRVAEAVQLRGNLPIRTDWRKSKQKCSCSGRHRKMPPLLCPQPSAPSSSTVIPSDQREPRNLQLPFQRISQKPGCPIQAPLEWGSTIPLAKILSGLPSVLRSSTVISERPTGAEESAVALLARSPGAKPAPALKSFHNLPMNPSSTQKVHTMRAHFALLFLLLLAP